MSTGLKVVIGLVVAGLIVGGSIATTLISTHNNLASLEQGVIAQKDQNKNSYDSMYKSVFEQAGVTTKYAKDFKEAYDGIMTGRYGDEGSQAVFQMITESNPNLDASLYKTIQQTITSNRESFKADQKMLVDKVNVYKLTMRQFPTNLVASLLGYPKVDLSQYGIVTSSRTEGAFQTGKDEPLEIK